MARMIVCVLSLLALVAQAKLKTTWDVTDYVQDGLIANYDGIKNAGKDNPHDSTRNEWVDLVSGGTAKLVFPDSTKDSGEWKDTGYRFEGGSYFETPAKLTLGNEFTVQLVTDTDMSRIDASHQYPAMWACGEFSIYLIHTSDTNVEKKNIAWKEDSYTDTNQSDKTTRRPIFQWDAKYVNAAFDAKYSYMVQTPYWIDEEKNRFERKDPVTVSAQNYTWGGRKSGGKNEEPLNANCCSRGMIYAWRAYSRKLTDKELLKNRIVDEIRFRGANILPITNVVIMADSLGRTGVESAGVYMVDGEHIFTAQDIITDSCTYELVGYTLSEWDEAKNSWGTPVIHEGTSYEYVVSETSPKVRLSWIWEFTDGVERVDTNHYIQNGLIANYDGIRNMGANQPHDSTKEEWIDLVEDGGTATLVKTEDDADFGEWLDTGYRFMGYSYFKTSNTIELGNEFTVQLVTDTELGFVDKKTDGKVLHEFQNLWAAGPSFGIFLNRQHAGAIAATNIIWKEDAYTDNNTTRPNFPWDGKYVNAAFDADYSYLSQDPYWINGSYYQLQRTNAVSVGSLNYCWGGCSSTRYCSIGTIHAWRAYSRKLTDDELAWNREIDEIRFRGALPKYIPNAVAVTSSRSEFTAKEDGVYLLAGSYAFTAERKVIDGITYAPKYEVQSWNGESGNWEAVSSGSSGSCLLNQADSTVPRRIVWKWFKEGFSVIIR